jgi:C1A family cysteine protease
MFHFFILCTSLLTMFTCGNAFNDEWQQFSNFIDRFERKYDSIDEFENRFQIFRTNLRNIVIHNSDHAQNFTMGINQFTDLTPEEFKSQYVSGYKPLQSFGCETFSSSDSKTPSSVDWTKNGVVNSVRDQGQCGSCWAFATTANAESVWAISKGELLDLSEEFLVDCASGVGYFNLGCNGGQPDSAFKYMINNGQCTETSYPYTSGVTRSAGSCQKCISADVSFSGCYDVKQNDQVSLKAAVSQQPVVIAIEADTRYFQSYSSGILTDAIQCGTTLDHAVEIVGYGTENGIDYWKVRNSWSSTWGEQGYVRIQKSSSTNDIGVCGIAAQPSYIVV